MGQDLIFGLKDLLRGESHPQAARELGEPNFIQSQSPSRDFGLEAWDSTQKSTGWFEMPKERPAPGTGDWSGTGSKQNWQRTRQRTCGSSRLPLTGRQWDRCSELAHRHKVERKEKWLFLPKEPEDGSFLYDRIATTGQDWDKGVQHRGVGPRTYGLRPKHQAPRLQKDRGHT